MTGLYLILGFNFRGMFGLSHFLEMFLKIQSIGELYRYLIINYKTLDSRLCLSYDFVIIVWVKFGFCQYISSFLNLLDGSMRIGGETWRTVLYMISEK